MDAVEQKIDAMIDAVAIVALTMLRDDIVAVMPASRDDPIPCARDLFAALHNRIDDRIRAWTAEHGG